MTILSAPAGAGPAELPRRIGTCIVLAKRPVPGRVKTRLTPAVSADVAARLAAAAIADTVTAVDHADVDRRVLVVDSPGPDLDRPGWVQLPQCAGPLDVRIVDAFQTAGYGPTILIGMDTPQVAPAELTAFDPSRFDAALGLAADGGWWALALRDPGHASRAVSGIPMSTGHTGAAQLARLGALGMRVQLLPSLVDVDTLPDAHRVAGLAPAGGFARVLREAVA